MHSRNWDEEIGIKLRIYCAQQAIGYVCFSMRGLRADAADISQEGLESVLARQLTTRNSNSNSDDRVPKLIFSTVETVRTLIYGPGCKLVERVNAHLLRDFCSLMFLHPLHLLSRLYIFH